MRGNLEPDAITRMTEEYVASLPVTNDPYYREAALKFIIREFAWAMLSRFPDSKYEISEQLEGMSEAVKEAKQ